MKLSILVLLLTLTIKDKQPSKYCEFPDIENCLIVVTTKDYEKMQGKNQHLLYKLEY